MIGVLGTAALVLALFLPPLFRVALASYLVLTLAYSFALKRKAMLDVIMLAALHTLRVIAGTLAIGAEWSFWLLAFSLFVFFSLALAKRVAELANLALEGRETAPGRGYSVSDRPFLTMTGVSTGYLSVLVVALYINSDKVLRVYSEPMLLWLVCPVLMYWIGRIWLETSRWQHARGPDRVRAEGPREPVHGDPARSDRRAGDVRPMSSTHLSWGHAQAPPQSARARPPGRTAAGSAASSPARPRAARAASPTGAGAATATRA